MRTVAQITKGLELCQNQLKEIKDSGVVSKYDELLAQKKHLERGLKIIEKRQFRKDTGLHVFLSHDYGGLDTRKYHFYYGYEYTLCPVHGNDSGCSCDDREWAFRVTENDKEIYRVGDHDICPEHMRVGIEEMVLYGIGHFLSRKDGSDE